VKPGRAAKSRNVCCARQGRRRGTVALEEVILLATFLPLVFGAFLLMRMVSVYVYNLIDYFVGWPLLCL